MFGCASDVTDKGETGTAPADTTTTTTTTTNTTNTTNTTFPTTSTGDLTVSCSATSNALRFDCTATAEGSLTWGLIEDDATVRSLVSEGPDHAVTLYGMAPNSNNNWGVTGDAGTTFVSVDTGSLPSDMGISLTTTGSTEAVRDMLYPCNGYLVVSNTDGDIVWYEQVSSGGGGGPSAGIAGFEYTDNGTFLTIVSGQEVIEWGMDGSQMMTANDFPEILHHDVDYADGYIYALTEFDAGGIMVDGFYVVDAEGNTVKSWDVSDHVTINPSGGGFGGAEWGHSNSIHVQDGRALISLRWQNAVMEVNADPNDANFGEIGWVLTGAGSDLMNNFDWTDGGGFQGQHHARWTPEGELSIFDNNSGTTSRGLRMAVDTTAMTVEETMEWSMGQVCDIQGANYELPGGGAILTCGDGAWAQVMSASGEQEWRVDAQCGSGGGGGGGGGPGGGGGRGGMVPRMMPLLAW
jgi:hypothetical protein